MTFYDCHAHIFNIENVPDGFMGFKLGLTDKIINMTADYLSWLIPSSEDRLEGIAEFERHLTKTQYENYEQLVKYYKEYENIVINVLTVDMSSMQGKMHQSFIGQLLDALEVKNAIGKNKDGTNKINLFMHISPNAEYVDTLMSNYLDKVDGIKIYPALDSPIDHPKLDKVFRTCVEKNLPVIAHCGPYGVSSPTFLDNLFTQNLNHPKNWRPVLKKYPTLKVDLAHFGAGRMEWQEEIVSLMKEYPGVYTDTSYSCGADSKMRSYKRWLDKESIVGERMLFGTDHYMVDLYDNNLQDNIERVRKHFGDGIFNIISEVNPKRFLEEVC